MQNPVKKFMNIHTALLFVLGIGGWFVLKYLFPEVQIKGYSIIPLFFYVMGVALFWKLSRISLTKPMNTSSMYMRMRVIKVFISFAIIIAYWLINKPGIRAFAIVFSVFYLIYLIWETFVFLRMEKYIRYKKNQNKPSE